MPASASPPEPQQLLSELLACSPEEVPRWIATHQPQLTLAFLQALKDTYAITTFILAEPLLAERATRYGLLVAEQMADESLALPLALWACGMYEMFHAPEKAVTLFQQAQPAYRAAGDTLSVAFLNVNLVGVLAECGRFAEAEIAYHAARPALVKLIDDKPIYLLWLDQNYGWLLYSQGRYTEALAVLDQALILAQRHNFYTNITGIQVNRHLALGMLGRLAEVEAGFLQERETAQTQRQALTVARIDMNLGDLYTWQGRVANALQHFQMAQQLFTTLGNEMEIASVLFRQAGLLSRIGARRAAIRHYAQALPIFRQRAMTPQVGELLVSYAIARQQEGEYRQATALLADAEQVWQQLANSLWLARVRAEQVALALEQEDYPAAQGLLETTLVPSGALRLQAEFHLLQADLWRLTATAAADDVHAAQQAYNLARTYAQTHNERWFERRALVGLGKLWLTSDPLRATAFFEQAAALDTAMRQTLTVEELKASFHEQANDLFDDLIRLHLAHRQPEQALHYSWRAKAGALFDLLQAVEDKLALSPAVQSAIEQTRQQIATLRWQLATQTDSQAPQPLSDQSNEQIVALEQQLLDLRRQRNQAQVLAPPASRSAMHNPAASVAQMTADLLVEFVRCGDDIFGIVADQQGGCVGLHLCDVETIVDLQARLQLRFGNVVAQPAERRRQWHERWLAECLPLLQRCYHLLIAPLVARLPQAAVATRILIAPCDPLFLLPFAAFWNGQRFWCEAAQIELIASGALLGNAQPVASRYTAPLIVAAATGSMTAVRVEAQGIAEVLPNSVVFVDTPVLPYLRSLSAPPQILHIAAHSLLRADAPLFTGLQLCGEVLTVEQSYELPLHGTQLVTLSGCTTASGQESESALLAFQTAFLLAGAQRVLTTLWPIADDATAWWMTHFYSALASGLTVPQALQRTQQWCLADPALRHPALWAPFTVTRR